MLPFLLSVACLIALWWIHTRQRTEWAENLRRMNTQLDELIRRQ